MRNFRDLGGHISKDGRTVKKGLFFRSGHLQDLNDEDINILKNLNIKNIFDYRNEKEAERNPSTQIENIINIRVKAMDMPDVGMNNYSTIDEMIEEIFDKGLAFNMMKESYYNLPINNESYKRLVELVKNPDMIPILSHCTAGKDRTGVGCSIILMILGVCREDIIKEYLKSNDYAKIFIEEVVTANPELKNVPQEKMEYIFGVKEDYINEAFRKIDENYETIEEYLYGEYSLSNQDLTKLRDIYLE
ncbi:MAG: tyrosine-protein phosphatase [Peptostreptococcaceae bacterium]